MRSFLVVICFVLLAGTCWAGSGTGNYNRVTNYGERYFKIIALNTRILKLALYSVDSHWEGIRYYTTKNEFKEIGDYKKGGYDVLCEAIVSGYCQRLICAPQTYHNIGPNVLQSMLLYEAKTRRVIGVFSGYDFYPPNEGTMTIIPDLKGFIYRGPDGMCGDEE